MRQTIKKWLYLFRYRNSNIKLDKGVSVGGMHTEFGGWNRIGRNTFFAGSLGKYSYIGDCCHIVAKIGKFCSIANHVNTVSGTHPTRNWVSTHPVFYSTACPVGISFVDTDKFEEKTSTIQIGNDVWIGDGATILGGTIIGDGAIIAAGAVVTKNVLPYEIVGGVPAHRIRMRFSDYQIAELTKRNWCEKDEMWLKEHSADFTNIDVFLEGNK